MCLSLKYSALTTTHNLMWESPHPGHKTGRFYYDTCYYHNIAVLPQVPKERANKPPLLRTPTNLFSFQIDELGYLLYYQG